MLRIVEQGNPADLVKGYLADMGECMSEIVYGLEEAIATAQVEWCEGQYSAIISDAESMGTVAEIDQYGTISLAPISGWDVEIA